MKKSVLLAIGCSKIGGAQKMFATIVEGLKCKQFNVIIVLPEGKLAEMFRDKGIEVHICEFDSIRILCQIARILRDNEIDIINTHLTNCSFFFAIVNLIYRKPIVCSLHNAVLHEGLGKLQRFYFPVIYYLISRFSNRIIINSNSNKEHFIEAARIDASHLEVVYNGINPSNYIIESQQVHYPNKKFQIGFVGRLSIEKGVLYLLEALSRLSIVDFECVIVGDGPLKSFLENEVKIKGLSERVKFVGFQENVIPFFQQMDVFVLPSLNEVMPITIIEAFALKTIVIASEVGGVPDLIKNKITGVLFSSKNSYELQSNITWVYDNPKIVESIVETAFNSFLTTFTSDAMIENTIEVYKLCLSSNTKLPNELNS